MHSKCHSKSSLDWGKRPAATCTGRHALGALEYWQRPEPGRKAAVPACIPAHQKYNLGYAAEHRQKGAKGNSRQNHDCAENSMGKE